MTCNIPSQNHGINAVQCATQTTSHISVWDGGHHRDSSFQYATTPSHSPQFLTKCYATHGRQYCNWTTEVQN